MGTDGLSFLKALKKSISSSKNLKSIKNYCISLILYLPSENKVLTIFLINIELGLVV